MTDTRRSNFFKVRHQKPWTIRDVVEKVGGKDFEEVKKQELEKRKGK